MPSNKFKSFKEPSWHCDMERDCIRAYFSLNEWKSLELVCDANVVVCSWFDSRISLKEPKVVNYESIEMNKTQTYRTLGSYSGWMRSTHVCNDSLSLLVAEWVLGCIRLSSSKILMRIHRFNGPDGTSLNYVHHYHNNNNNTINQGFYVTSTPMSLKTTNSPKTFNGSTYCSGTFETYSK